MNILRHIWDITKIVLFLFQASKKKPASKKKLDKATSNLLDSSFEQPAAMKPAAAEKPKPKSAAAEKPKPKSAAAEKPKPKPVPAKKKEAWESSDDEDEYKFGGDKSDSADSDFGLAKKKAPAPKSKPKSVKSDSDSDAGTSWKPSKALKNGDDDGDDFDALVERGGNSSPVFGKKKPVAKKTTAEKKRPAATAGK